ncbi:hypothetical protein BDF20DRAFT_915357 [Mycotypha africana]|uniref:uncharacterized protein n=1 Tax=Mycotypha africana TaxID=64632 RepID=UPI0023014ACA|nr:uncharacterized protein BDF20DRAFT_915357 [Mycotypha africana]KAI8971558.1 hypothetical protein BDF20DRAFT_915357 [Mycotypha africana]
MDTNTHHHPPDLPEHLPIDMAYAPNQKPFSKRPPTHAQPTNDPHEHQNRLAQHSLSPEKLGVVGYVKDVAGFVKDVVKDRKSKRGVVGRRNSESSVSSTDNNLMTAADEPNTAAVTTTTTTSRPRHSSVGEHEIRQNQRSSSPFAEAITGLFPGVSARHDTNEPSKGCTHADELRSQAMHMNEQNQNMGLGHTGLVHK